MGLHFIPFAVKIYSRFACTKSHFSVTDLPHLTTISLSRPLSGSPFPSPSSAFLTPPEEGTHEFNLKTSRLSQSMQNITTPNHENVVHLPALDGEATPTLSSSAKGTESVSSPVTPVPSTPQPNQPSRASTGSAPITARTVSTSSLSATHRDSLTSSRPAPPSPAVSRRASAALSRHSSSARSTRQSRDFDKLTSSVTSNATKRGSKARSWLFKVRDFAFLQSDERHDGRGPDAPRPNRPRHRTSTLSTSSASSNPEESNEDRDEELGRHGWGSFRWNTLSSHFSWGNKPGGQGEASGPSHTDFERNFDMSSPTNEATERPYDDDDDDDEYQEGDEYEYAQEGGPLAPGLYKALYAFEPEGAAEMALEEGQVVKIIARGGGVGWAVVEKDDGEHALVPEGYLELVQPDDQQD